MLLAGVTISSQGETMGTYYPLIEEIEKQTLNSEDLRELEKEGRLGELLEVARRLSSAAKFAMRPQRPNASNK
jgi:hypothetical protein